MLLFAGGVRVLVLVVNTGGTHQEGKYTTAAMAKKVQFDTVTTQVDLATLTTTIYRLLPAKRT